MAGEGLSTWFVFVALTAPAIACLSFVPGTWAVQVAAAATALFVALYAWATDVARRQPRPRDDRVQLGCPDTHVLTDSGECELSGVRLTRDGPLRTLDEAYNDEPVRALTQSDAFMHGSFDSRGADARTVWKVCRAFRHRPYTDLTTLGRSCPRS